MSELSYLEKLLNGVEVEWVALNHVFDIFAGGDVPKDSFSDVQTTEYNIPILSNGIGDKSLYGWTDKAKIHSPSLTISARGTIGWTSYSEAPFFPIVRLLVLTPKTQLNLKYAYYFMKMIEGDYNVPKTGIPQLTKPMLKDITIPIPCSSNPERSLVIQSEIVRILDSFTALTAELTAELTARKKQYNHYRNQLLSFEECEVEWKSLEEVSDIYDSLHQTPQYADNGLSMIRVTDIKNGYVDLNKTLKVNNEVFSVFTRKYTPLKNDLVMSRVGSYGNVGIIPLDNMACMGQNTVVIHPRINSSYLFYILSSNIGQGFIERNVGGGSQKTLSLKSIKAIPIPIVNEKEQLRIASILGKFDTLTNSIIEGLPREIALRKQQYEYYRDLLFRFPKPDVVSQ